MQELLYLLLSLREPLLLPQMLAEGKGGGGNHLEVLDSERNPDDGDAEEKTADEVNRRDLPESGKDPNDIHHHRQTTGFFVAKLHLAPERPHDISAKFKQLDPEWNSDNGYAHQQTHQVVKEGNLQSPEDQPKDVSYNFHINLNNSGLK